MLKTCKFISAVCAVAFALVVTVLALGVAAFVHWLDQSAVGNLIVLSAFVVGVVWLAIGAYRDFEKRAYRAASRERSERGRP